MRTKCHLWQKLAISKKVNLPSTATTTSKNRNLGANVKKLVLPYSLIACLIGGPLMAQPAAEPSQQVLFETFLHSDLYHSYIDQAFNMIEPPTLKAECPQLKALEFNVYSPIQPVSVTGSGEDHRVSAGAWVAHPVFDRCGKRVKRRALLQVQPDGTIRPIALLPGDFRGDLTLERDARRIIFPGMMAKLGCKDSKDFFIIDVTRQSETTDGGWLEVWTGRGCGKDVTADVTYDRHADGIVVTGQNFR
jgi:hypothetical protein